jgi:hypothetical protein
MTVRGSLVAFIFQKTVTEEFPGGLDRTENSTIKGGALSIIKMPAQWSPHRQEPVAPFKNATSREFRIPPPAGVYGPGT